MATTLRQIAKRSGYSLATAAYALQGHPRVARRTREAIERVAREMGYVPDRAAAILGKPRGRAKKRGDGPVVARWHWTDPRSRSELAWGGVMDRALAGRAAALGYSYQRENLWGV